MTDFSTLARDPIQQFKRSLLATHFSQENTLHWLNTLFNISCNSPLSLRDLFKLDGIACPTHYVIEHCFSSSDQPAHSTGFRMTPEDLPVLLDALFSKGILGDTRDHWDRTLFHLLAAKGFTAAFDHCAKRFPEVVHLTQSYGQSSLHYAAKEHQEDPSMLLALLNRHGFDVNEQDDDGKTTLNLAIANDNVAQIKVLTAHGININLPDQKGNTPLHYAALHSSPQVVRLLVEGGGCYTVMNQEQRTPLSFAEQNSDPAVLSYLNSVRLSQMERHLLLSEVNINSDPSPSITTGSVKRSSIRL